MYCALKGTILGQERLLLLLSRFSRVRLCVTPETAAHQAPCPWDSPGKNTGVGCHFLLRCMKVKSESEVVQSCLTLCDPMDCSLPGSSIYGIFQARVLEWGAIAFSWAGEERPFINQTYIEQCMCQSTVSNGDAKINNPVILASRAPSFVLKLVIKLKIAMNVTSTATGKRCTFEVQRNRN